MGMNIAAGIALGIVAGTLVGIALSLYRQRGRTRRGGASGRVNDILTGASMVLGAVGGGLVAAPL